MRLLEKSKILRNILNTRQNYKFVGALFKTSETTDVCGIQVFVYVMFLNLERAYHEQQM